MMKKFLMGVILSLSLSGNVSAQEVTVTGIGADKDSAIRDATRLAIEQVVGTFIDSRTLMENLRIQMDEVYKKSQGYVKRIQSKPADTWARHTWLREVSRDSAQRKAASTTSTARRAAANLIRRPLSRT